MVETVSQIPECIALLGASGFVGGAVLRQIESAPDGVCKAHILQHETLLEKIPGFATLHHGALTNIPQDFLPQVPHVVLHCASKQVDRDGTGFDVNLRGMDALANAINAHTRAIIYISSYSVYGDDAQRDIAETAPLRPESALAQSRADCEQRLAALANTGRCRVIICRTRFVLGTDDRFVLPGIARLARARVKVGSGEQRFSVIAVDDFARILLMLASQALNPMSATGPCETYNVSYAQPISMNEIYAALADSMPIQKPRWHIPVNERLLRWLGRMPSQGAQQLVQRLRLIGYDHYGDVRKLQSQLGNDWLQADPRDVVRKIAASLSSRSGTLQ